MVSASRLSRRRFLQRSLAASTLFALPTIIPGSALGLNGAVAPSERVVLGGIGIGNRGKYDLGCFLEQPDVQCVAVCDVRGDRRKAAKEMVDEHHKNNDCRAYRDLRELLDRKDIDAVLIATGPNWHALAAAMAARAGKDIYCEKPCTKNIVASVQLTEIMRQAGRVFQAGTQRRSLPHFAFACELARTGKLGELKKIYAHPGGLMSQVSGWRAAEQVPPQDEIDWDLYLGPAAWRPFNHELLDTFNFEKGGGMVGGGVLEWGSHCIDLCQWAMADAAPPVEYHPPQNDQIVCKYASGTELIIREQGWIPLGSCPIRFEGSTGWVETGDSGKLMLSSPELLAGRKIEIFEGYPATFHVRNFLDCVKTRREPRTNAVAACNAHIACHAANIALALNRKVQYDPVAQAFVGDQDANRLRSESLREPWRL